jgi:hypothetical protein
MVDTVFLLTVVPMKEGVFEGSIVVLPMRVELVEFVCGPWVKLE